MAADPVRTSPGIDNPRMARHTANRLPAPAYTARGHEETFAGINSFPVDQTACTNDRAGYTRKPIRPLKILENHFDTTGKIGRISQDLRPRTLEYAQHDRSGRAHSGCGPGTTMKSAFSERRPNPPNSPGCQQPANSRRGIMKKSGSLLKRIALLAALGLMTMANSGCILTAAVRGEPSWAVCSTTPSSWVKLLRDDPADSRQPLLQRTD